MGKKNKGPAEKQVQEEQPQAETFAEKVGHAVENVFGAMGGSSKVLAFEAEEEQVQCGPAEIVKQSSVPKGLPKFDKFKQGES